ncbi:MAG: hypothetical protein AAF710_02550 [Planctomycetota bacterium]
MPDRQLLLVIDDDPTILEIFRQTTAAFPFEARGFTGPAEMLAEKPAPDEVACILLDRDLDYDIDGLELMPLFESDYALSPVIVTGDGPFTWRDTVRYVVEGRAYATWSKDRTAADLWNLVQTAVAVHLRRTERFRQRKWGDIQREEIGYAMKRNRGGTLDDVAADLGLTARQLRYQMRKHEVAWRRSA